jgi:hypothetical protein
LLRPDRLLLLGDIVAPGVSALTDTIALLGFATKDGFLSAALARVLRTMLSD